MYELVGDLGLRRTATGVSFRVWSAHATSMVLRVFDRRDPDWVRKTLPMERDERGVWHIETDLLDVGVPYAIGVDGPSGPPHAFDVSRHAMPPHARGLVRTPRGDFRATVIDPEFDWASSKRPTTPLDRTVIYEAHARGLTKLNHHMPEHLRGTYAGIAHPSTIDYLRDLGITAIELLPVQQFVSEQRLIRQGRVNYWGYNTLNFFTPHNLYASRAAQFDGTGGVLREFKGMVKLLHEAGIQVLMDVVYNHTAEEGPGGPPSSLRLIDNASYYRTLPDGSYIDVTGCGNTVDYSSPAATALVIDSLRYWAHEVQVDGFRFDLAVALGRDERAHFTPDHPLLHAITNDPQLAGLTMIAEPWDVGLGGWQVGGFREGWSEWNDGYRDAVRQFWLGDLRELQAGRPASTGVGPLAHVISGSQGVFATERGPLASVNFVTAHDGFTLTDLTRYDEKHNWGNGESNNDGTSHNRSFNHGVEGRTDVTDIQIARRRSMRNVLGTLLMSAGVPMITAGDEFGRTQRGNNNAYCLDSALTWMPWQRKPWQDAFLEQTKKLLALRRENPALRPLEFGRDGVRVAGSSRLDWFNRDGAHMTLEDWDHSLERTLVLLAESTPISEDYSRVLVIAHGSPTPTLVTLPDASGATSFELLWDSAEDHLETETASAGDRIELPGMSLRVYRVEGEPSTGVPIADHRIERDGTRPLTPPEPPSLG